jgi:hypothetical protein
MAVEAFAMLDGEECAAPDAFAQGGFLHGNVTVYHRSVDGKCFFRDFGMSQMMVIWACVTFSRCEMDEAVRERASAGRPYECGEAVGVGEDSKVVLQPAEQK